MAQAISSPVMMATARENGTTDPLGETMDLLESASALIAGALDKAFPMHTAGFACSRTGDATMATGPELPASAHWMSHLTAAWKLYQQISQMDQPATDTASTAMFSSAPWRKMARRIVASTSRGDTAKASHSVIGQVVDEPSLDLASLEGAAHALAHRFWHLRAWLSILALSQLLDGADRKDRGGDAAAKLARLLTEDAPWTILTASTRGCEGYMILRAPTGTVDVTGLCWPTPRTAGRIAGTNDPIGLAKAAGAQAIAITGMATDIPECSFETRFGYRIRVSAVGEAIAELASIASVARFGTERGKTFIAGGTRWRAWTSERAGQVEALHLRMDTVSAPDSEAVPPQLDSVRPACQR